MKISLSDKEMIRIIEEKFATLMFEGYEIGSIEKRYSSEWEIEVIEIDTEPEVDGEV